MTTRTTKTIDNLGIDVYKRYGEDQETFEEVYVRESKRVAIGSQLDVFLPIYEGEVSLLLELSEKAHPWAALTVPDKYNEQRKRLFTSQLTPAMGPQDKLEMQEERIEEVKQEHEQKEKKKGARLMEWETQQEEEEVAIQAKKLLDLLQDILLFNKIIAEVNAERYRYNKG